MNRGISAIGGGVVGTAILSALMIMLSFQTRGKVGIFEAIARFVGVPNRIVIGFVLFAAAGVFLWPLLFVVLEPYIPLGPDPANRGMVLASVLWIAFVLTSVWYVSWPIIIVYAVATLIAHLAYGFALGSVYAYLREPLPGGTTPGESTGA